MDLTLMINSIIDFLDKPPHENKYIWKVHDYNNNELTVVWTPEYGQKNWFILDPNQFKVKLAFGPDFLDLAKTFNIDIEDFYQKIGTTALEVVQWCQLTIDAGTKVFSEKVITGIISDIHRVVAEREVEAETKKNRSHLTVVK